MKEFRKRSDGLVISEIEFRNTFPNISFPEIITNDIAKQYEHDLVNIKAAPIVNEFQVVKRDGVEFEDEVCVYKWLVTDLTSEEIAVIQENKNKAIENLISRKVQKRLDDFAHTRGYGDERGNGAIVSACSYALSNNPTRAAEAAYCISARDETWDAVFVIKAAVVGGTRSMPVSYEEIESELPTLTWPA